MAMNSSCWSNEESDHRENWSLPRPRRSNTLRPCSVIPIPCGLDEIEKNLKDFDLFFI
jgi:hypothetical protein